MVSAFYVGLAALQVGDDVHADSRLSEVTRLVPAEPAGWANWGILALRQRNYDTAAQRLDRARDLAPQNDRIYDLLGILDSQRGQSAQAIADLRKAVELNPKNLRALYRLAEETERQGDENGSAEVQQLLQKILAAQPDNLAALLELSRIAAKRGDAATLKSAVAQISARSSAWPPEVQHQLAAVQSATAAADLRPAATQTTFLRNVMMRVPEYRQSLTAIKAPPGDEAEPFTHFLKLESPVFRPAPADTALTFNPQTDLAAKAGKSRWNWIGAIPLGSAGAPVVAVANAREVRLSTGATIPFPGGASVPPLPEGLRVVDFEHALLDRQRQRQQLGEPVADPRRVVVLRASPGSSARRSALRSTRAVARAARSSRQARCAARRRSSSRRRRRGPRARRHAAHLEARAALGRAVQDAELRHVAVGDARERADRRELGGARRRRCATSSPCVIRHTPNGRSSRRHALVISM